MNNIMTAEKQQSFIEKYKKWFIALVGMHVIPSIIIISVVIGGIGYNILNNDINFHSYKSYIISGFKVGHADGEKNSLGFNKAPWTLWMKYDFHTDKLKEKINLERKEYLSQFPESERGAKLAEMKLNNIKLPLELELKKRFSSSLNFYADHVKQRVKKEDFNSDDDYLKALQDEAWKVGYAHGYLEGQDGSFYSTARRTLY